MILRSGLAGSAGVAGMRRGAAPAATSPRLAAATAYGAAQPQWLSEEVLGRSADVWTPSRPVGGWHAPNPSWNSDPAPSSSSGRGLFLSTEDDTPVCSALGCSAKPRFWRRTARPVFEGRWACSRGCLESLVRSALHRELIEGAEPTAPHQHRIPLGLVLLSQGVIDEAQLRASLAAQKNAGSGRIGDWLVQQGAATESAITRALARQWGCPVLREEMLAAETMSLAMPGALRAALRLQPLCVAGRRYLYAGFEDQLNAAGVFALERMSGLTVVPGVLSEVEYRNCEQRLEDRASVRCERLAVQGEDALVGAILKTLMREEPAASRMVGVQGRVWMRLWLEPGVVGASGTLPVSGADMLDVLFE